MSSRALNSIAYRALQPDGFLHQLRPIAASVQAGVERRAPLKEGRLLRMG
jgi:hypothetical protein